MNYFEITGLNILDVLKEKNMNQTELADKIGVSKQVMSKIIKGQKAINVEEIKKIADILTVDVNRLTEDRNNISEDDESLVMLMGTVGNKESKETLAFLNEVIDELIYMEELLND